jgi:hypothetical protein
MIAAVVFLALRMANKFTVSELMYRRHRALLLENSAAESRAHPGT